MLDPSEINGQIHVRIVPVAEEDDDLETLGLVENVRANFLAEISSLQMYKVERISDQTRGGGLIALTVAKIARKILAQKDLIVELLQTSQPVIESLAESKHVQEVEVTIDGNSIRIEKPTEAQTNRLVEIYEAVSLGKTQQVTLTNTVEITATVSKDEPPAIAEQSTTGQDK